MGVTVVGIGLIGVTAMYWIFKDITVVAGFGFGASSIALFARVGGGIVWIITAVSRKCNFLSN